VRWFFKRVWCPLFGHAKKTVKMPFFEAWFDQVHANRGTIHCARCGTMVGDYGVPKRAQG
jgi:hypothetical protein